MHKHSPRGTEIFTQFSDSLGVVDLRSISLKTGKLFFFSLNYKTYLSRSGIYILHSSYTLEGFKMQHWYCILTELFQINTTEIIISIEARLVKPQWMLLSLYKINCWECVLAWRIPGMGEPGGLPSTESQSRTRIKRLSSSSSSSSSVYIWRRKWQPTPAFLPGESQGRGSLVGCCLWGCTESDTTEVT